MGLSPCEYPVHRPATKTTPLDSDGSQYHDPRCVLFADDEQAPLPLEEYYKDSTYGFYWTEGLRGLGWAQDCVPPLKGGSGLGIASPPAIWIPSAEIGQQVILPSIEDGERLQGFEPGWTALPELKEKVGLRWKMVGNAISTTVTRFFAGRLLNPGEVCVSSK